MSKFASRRLKNRDYASPGRYFVTICSDFKRCIFGTVEGGMVRLSKLGQIAEEAWLALAQQFPGIRLHGHVVMPNHVHGIVEVRPDKQAQQAAPLQRAGADATAMRRAASLSITVRAFKANVTRRAGVELGWTERIWRHNYYDRVIRDDREFSNAMRYIAENPLRWQCQGAKIAANREVTSKRPAQQAAPLQRGRI